MDAGEARRALEAAGLAVDSIEPILGGWASFTFDVDGEWIAQFPRDAEIAAAAHRQLALLPELADHLPFRVPRPEIRGTYASFPFYAYRRIAGRAMTTVDTSPGFLDALAATVRALHVFPVDRAATLLDTGPAERAWRRLFEKLWPAVEAEALPALEPALADQVRAEYTRFLDQIDDVPCCLVHNDLGPEHVLVAETGTRPVGIIDFESSWVGDPAADIWPLVATLGRETFEPLTAGRDLGPRLLERMWFYRWMAAVHNIIYGVRRGMEHERQLGIDGLRRRIGTPIDQLF